MNTYDVEYTDTFSGEANYSWVKRAKVVMPELSAKAYRRELMRKAKAAMGLTGVRGRVNDYGDTIDFRPYGSCTVMFISYAEEV